MTKGKLLICATPIGNLNDVTLRVLETLKEVNFIAAEDTRHTRKLLSHYGIKAKIISYREQNEKTKSKELLLELEKGARIALVSDAGMPGLSDPGYRLIKLCIEGDIEVEVLPGPSAAISALVASGLPTDSFIFQGFLPQKKGERRKILEELADNRRTLIFYESPHRIESFLGELLEIIGDRKMVLAREITKKFEEFIRGNVSEVLSSIKANKIKGEIVVVVKGGKNKPEFDDETIRHKVKELMDHDFTKKEAIQTLAKELGISKRTVYESAKHISARGIKN
ncbi:MAG TPA: 16S rRNA (cytidine(1402)-2'-O)-methyltransferase [Actinobacteria bacterium]|nr:16S rRNA (cytidine(1402)-2'-O)-methyltransferase [Actinomycetota bacterium]